MNVQMSKKIDEKHFTPDQTKTRHRKNYKLYLKVFFFYTEFLIK